MILGSDFEVFGNPKRKDQIRLIDRIYCKMPRPCIVFIRNYMNHHDLRFQGLTVQGQKDVVLVLERLWNYVGKSHDFL